MFISMAILTVTGIFLIISEFVIRSRQDKNIDHHEAKISILVGAVWFGAKGVGGAIGLVTFYAWVSSHWAPWQLPLNNPLTWIAYWLIGDFFYYWLHRAEHKVPALWASHLVHHSSTDFSFITAVRMPPTEIFYKPFTGLWAPLLGFPPAMYGPMSAWGLITGQLQHTQIIGSLGWMDRWLNTPSNHRVHHGTNEQYIDTNFGGQTVLWDRLFGTYAPEVEPVVYGITKPLADNGLMTTIKGGYPDLLLTRRHRRLTGVS